MRKIISLFSTVTFLFSSLLVFWPTTAGAVVKDAVLEMRLTSVNGQEYTTKTMPVIKKGDKIKIEVWILNPSKQSLISAQTWMTYDAKKFKGEKIDFTDSAFDLQTPGEYKFVEKQNLVRLARGTTQRGGVTSTEAKVADVWFTATAATAGQPYFGWYDYQTSELGHTSVNIIDSGLPVNILVQAPKKLSVSLNRSATTAGAGTSSAGVGGDNLTVPPTTGSAEGLRDELINNYGTTHSAAPGELQPPTNIKVSSTGTTMRVRWTMVPGAQGVYLYYTTHAGQYLHRKEVRGSEYVFTNLQPGAVYYLVLSSFDATQESFYSQELKVTVGQTVEPQALAPGTIDSLDAVPQHPASGSDLWLYILLFVSGAVGLWSWGFPRRTISLSPSL